MADSDRGKPMQQVTFRCECLHQFKREPERIEDVPDDPFHAWRYFAACPDCGAEAEQAWWERNLLRAWSRATGPKTEAGKAAVTKNLEGHPTPEEARRTRFNAMKHGASARTATYYPARPGKYAECEGCEYREEVCPQQVACLKKMELFMQVHVALDSNDPHALRDIHANIQSSFLAVLQDMLRQVIADGPRLCNQAYYYDQKGGLHWVEKADEKTGETVPVLDYTAHPLLKIISDWLHKNGLSLEDLALTNKGQEDREIDMGFIEAEKETKDRFDEYQERTVQSLEHLKEQIERGQKRLKEDPVAIEHKGGQ